tara:strand:+ start:1321 stop:1839 length:519 start_codon:yes stop_codon:yes gene_type:complete
MTQLLTTTLRNRSELQSTLNELEQIGVRDEQITVLSNEKTHHKHFGTLDEDHQEETVEEGAAEAATSGGLVGAVLGGVITATSLALPGVNILVGGALAATLVGAGAGAMTGAVAGGLLGALGTYGVTEAEARKYEEDIRAGRILLMVKPSDESQHIDIARIIAEHDKKRLAA